MSTLLTTTITLERADTPDAMTLIAELDDVLAPLYPSESRHGFSVEKLLRQQVAFFVIRCDGQPAGCGGVKLFGPNDEGANGEIFGEVKRMYIRPQFRGQGLAKQMLQQLVAYSRAQGVTLLRLETGIHQQEAIRLYEGFGFKRIGPFGEYWDDPLSLFYELCTE